MCALSFGIAENYMRVLCLGNITEKYMQALCLVMFGLCLVIAEN